MGESNRKALGRTALCSVLTALSVGASGPLGAEPTRLSWLIGSGSTDAASRSYLWNRLEAEQWFGRERFVLAGDLQSLSMLSSQRKWGGGLGAGLSLSLGSSFEWLPSLRLEQDAELEAWEMMLQSSVRYPLWSLLLDTQVAVAPMVRAGARSFRLRQSVGMSLGEGASREDFLLLDFEFQDRIKSSTSAASALESSFRRFGIAFASQVEF